MNAKTPRTDAQMYYIDGHQHISANLGREIEAEIENLSADKRRLDALDLILAKASWFGKWGWRWSEASIDGPAMLYLSQDGKMLSARAAIDLYLKPREQETKQEKKST